MNFVSFYANGIETQPGCSSRLIHRRWICSHQRAYRYFAKSIESGPIYGCKSESIGDIKDKHCDKEKTASFGGEPGARYQYVF